MNAHEILEQVGWGKYQKRVFWNSSFGILKVTIWMQITLMIMENPEGTNIDPDLLPSFLNFGSVLGNMVLPYIASVKGRSPAHLTSGIASLIGGISLALNLHPYSTYFGLVAVGTGIGSDMILCYSVLIESIPPSVSNKYMTLSSVGWSLGTPLCLGIAFFNERVFSTGISSLQLVIYLGVVVQAFFTYERTLINETPVYLFEEKDMRFYDVLNDILKTNNNDKYLPMIEITSVEKSKDAHFRHMTFYLSIEYFFATFLYATLFFIMPKLLPHTDRETGYIIMLLQQFLSLPGILISGFYITTNKDSVIWRTISFCLAGVLIMMLYFDLSILLFGVITISINLLLWVGLSLLYTYSQDVYCYSSRTIMNGFFSGLGLSSGIFGNLLLDQVIQSYGKIYCLLIFCVSFIISGICPPLLHKIIG